MTLDTLLQQAQQAGELPKTVEYLNSTVSLGGWGHPRYHGAIIELLARLAAAEATIEAMKCCGNCDRDPQACDECDDCTWGNSQWIARQADHDA